MTVGGLTRRSRAAGVGNALPIVRRFGVWYTPARTAMATVWTRSWPSLAAVLMVAAAALLVAGCPGPKGSLEQISVVQYRYNVDEDSDVVRVLGQVRNGGAKRTPAGEVVVTLRSRTGSSRGSNRTELPPLEAGEEHQFALAITSHGKVETVDIAIVPPGSNEGGEDAGEVDGDGEDAQGSASNGAAEEGA